jgi:hypothetical protein
MVQRFSTRVLGLLLLCSSIAFVAASAPPQPSPQPSPVPPPLPSPAPASDSIGALPTVLIYPFDVQTGADPKLGFAIAQILAQEMAAAGGITVRAIPQGVKRADFLETARAASADFYISGYVTPVGDSAAVVEQVVSVESGVILFSQTAQVSSVADVASQSLLARSQILAFVGHDTESVQTQAANTPAPTSTNGAQVPISGIGSIVDSVFKHKGPGRTPAPAPATKPARGVIIAPVVISGFVVAAEVTNAARELYLALNRYFTIRMSAVTSPPAQSADAICGSDRNNTIAAGTLQETPASHNRVAVTFVLSIYTCFGAELDHQVGKGNSLKAAVDAAVAAYVKAHPDNS